MYPRAKDLYDAMLLAERGRRAFHESLAVGGLLIADAALVANEALERPARELGATARELLDSPDRPRHQVDRYRDHPGWLEADLARLRG